MAKIVKNTEKQENNWKFINEHFIYWKRNRPIDVKLFFIFVVVQLFVFFFLHFIALLCSALFSSLAEQNMFRKHDRWRQPWSQIAFFLLLQAMSPFTENGLFFFLLLSRQISINNFSYRKTNRMGNKNNVMKPKKNR